MTKLGTIEFDDCILDALRDDRLVVFAGAGVSMGPPSNLASFWELACNIAKGTGLSPSEPLDRFLGQLSHNNVAVHERTAQLLSPPGSAPNTLHHDLLRLFRTKDRIRLVTTNFDLHFETAANALFSGVPDIYRAPALPLGYDFSGIVHIHGALPRARDLVLTDADFGRAYLTEGWARRFLVDVFRRYTVLFVGYSHNDIVMNYLARSLPADSVAGRFALTDENGSWELLGIKPIRFVKGTGTDSYKELYDGLQRLAERVARGALDWQSRLAELGSRTPPTDEEAISEVEQALREVHTTRFLLNVARDPEWLRWLNGRKHLDTLFAFHDLGEREMLLVEWLSQHFAIEHSDEMFEIVAAHELRINPALWLSIGRELGLAKEKPLEEPAFKCWVSLLLASAPAQADHHVLMWLAERCANFGCIDLALKVFMTMSEHRLSLRPAFMWTDDDNNKRRRLDAECPLRTDHWPLSKVWTKYLKPQHARIAQPLLSGITQHLEEMHGELAAWGKASRDWDPISYRRSAIEPHEQDQIPEAVDVLIDAARDTLEWLAANTPMHLGNWIERLAASDVPLLRRLAIHAITVYRDQSPEERLKWLLDRIGLHDLSVHHEVYRAVALSYAISVDPARQSIIDAILGYSLPASDDRPAEMRTARLHFDWLTWLLQAKPDCQLADAALNPIKARYPGWQPTDHPDLTHWMGSVDWKGSDSPWSVEQLLAREPREQLNDLLNFTGNHFDGPNREGLLANSCEACKQSTSWAFTLAQALVEQALWSSDLWPALLRGLKESELPAEGWSDLLTLISNPTLQSAHAYDIANLLYALVRDGGKPFALDLLEKANLIALPLWQAMGADSQDETIDDWLSRAINCPAGVIVEFWLNGLLLLVRGKSGAERFMPENYRHYFTLVVQDATSKGGLGRTVLASQTAFLFGLDETWTCQHIVPLFSDSDKQRFAQAWNGFLVWGRLYPRLVDALLPAFIATMPRLADDLSNDRLRFIEFYTALAVFHVSDPMQQLIPALFQHGSLEERIAFASQLGHLLWRMQPASKQQLWNSWLHRYWQDRLQGVLAALDEDEIRKMLEWLPHLGDAFPDAVALAVRGPKIRIEQSSFLYELSESELVTQFAAATVELLIFLSNDLAGFQRNYLKDIDARLPQLPAQMRQRLDEAFARAGVL
ncbi:DUF4020 domain-containing protein [Aeromonas enteropelogenes]|uniref:DUF4020 domain-containing protein n=1 Tax=Aeromonas enteropelogenes TaxID=29489 RepID=UPI001CE3B58A|nr:DUF4020 domain-containing protein [Aeromonas enteropelogenes]UCA12748.1 DUF4020 domain-containing protein [Aeromonas enteropelogenes]